MIRRTSRMASVAVAAALCVLGMAMGSATALETPAPENAYVMVTPSTVAAADRITVRTSGWNPGTQLQAVVCGDNAVGGSTACDLPGAVTALTDSEGAATHVLTVAAPPRPCPCVVRVSTFTGAAMALNVPFTLQGHRTGTPPQVEPASSDLRVDDVELQGNGGIRAFLGLGGRTTMVVSLVNRGDAAAPASDLAYAFGRGNVQPESVLVPGVTVPAGGTQKIEIAVDVPMLAFGPHQAVAQWADGTGSVASAGLTVYPVGVLLVLLGAVAAAAITDLQRRRAKQQKEDAPTPGAHRFLDEDGSYPLPDVVFLEDIGGYLVKPAVLKNSRVTGRLTGRVRVSDLAVLVESDGAVASYPDGTPAAPPADGAGVGLRHFLWWERDQP